MSNYLPNFSLQISDLDSRLTNLGVVFIGLGILGEARINKNISKCFQTNLYIGSSLLVTGSLLKIYTGK